MVWEGDAARVAGLYWVKVDEGMSASHLGPAFRLSLMSQQAMPAIESPSRKMGTKSGWNSLWLDTSQVPHAMSALAIAVQRTVRQVQWVKR